MMKRLKLCLVVLKLWFLLRRSQILTVDSPEMWLLIITLWIPNNNLLPPRPDAIFKMLISFTSRLYSAHGLYDTLLTRFAYTVLIWFIWYDTVFVRYDTVLIRYNTVLIRYDTVLIRYGSCTIWYVSYTVRNASHTIRNAFHTIRYVSDSILTSHASCTLFRCSSTF